MKELEIKQGHLPDFTITVKDELGKALNLSSYDGVNFVMTSESGENKVNSVGAFVQANKGIITYNFSGSDTDTPGIYKAYFSLLSGIDKKLAVPTDYFIIKITDDFI